METRSTLPAPQNKEEKEVTLTKEEVIDRLQLRQKAPVVLTHGIRGALKDFNRSLVMRAVQAGIPLSHLNVTPEEMKEWGL